MNFNKQWYALYTSIDGEMKVANSLRKKKIEYYCPVNKVANKTSLNKKLISQPLFSRLIFVRLDKAAHKNFKQIPGVCGMMYWLNQHAFFPDEDIEMMRRFLQEHEVVQLKKIPVNRDEIVRVESNNLNKEGGKILSLNCRQTSLVLPSLGYIILPDVKPVKAISEKHNYITQTNPNLAFS